MKNPMKSFDPAKAWNDRRFTSKVWQRAFFNSPKDMSQADRMAAADAAWAADQAKQKAD